MATQVEPRATVAKIDRPLVAKAKLVAAHRGLSMQRLLSGLLQGPLDAAYVQMVRELESSNPT